MLKLLLLLLVVWIVLTLLRQRKRPSGPDPKPANMVRCAVCGVHLPESEAIADEGRHYCGDAHFRERDQA